MPPDEKLADLKELMLAKFAHLDAVLEERDKRYSERAEDQKIAVLTALAAMDKQNAAAFAASEKAIIKAEEAQANYNIRSNEFRGKLSDQATTLMPRTEVVALIKGAEDKTWATKAELLGRVDVIQKDITSLRESRSEGAGRSLGGHAMWGYVLAALSVIGSLIAMGAAIYRFGR